MLEQIYTSTKEKFNSVLQSIREEERCEVFPVITTSPKGISGNLQIMALD